MISNDQLRAIVLSVLMVASITLGSVTLTGSVGAASNVGVQIQDNSVGAQTNHSWSITSGGSGDLAGIALNYSGSGTNVSGLTASDVFVSINAGSKTPAVDSVNTPETYEAQIILNSSVSIGADDTVNISTANDEVVNPSSSGDYNAAIVLVDSSQTPIDNGGAGFSIQSSDGSTGQGTFTGTVTNNSSTNAIEGVTVTAYDSNNNAVNSSTTDSNGAYSFTVPNATYDLEATHSEYDTKEYQGVQVNDTETKTVDFALSPSTSDGGGSNGTFTGYVFDSDGNPVSGANVAAALETSDGTYDFENPTNFTKSATDGSFELGVPADTYFLGAEKDGNQGGAELTIGDGETINYNITLGGGTGGDDGSSDAATAQGYVKDKSGNLFIPTSDNPGFVVAVDDITKEEPQDVAFAEVNSSGGYSMGVPTGTYDLLAADEKGNLGFIRNVQFNDSEVVNKNISMDSSFSDRLPPGNFQPTVTNVYDSQAAGESVWVEAEIENTASNDGSQKVMLNHSGRSTTLDQRTVQVPAGDTQTVYLEWQTQNGDGGVHDLNVTTLNATAQKEVTVKPGGGYVSGVVKDSKGNPIPNAEVGVYDDTFETFRFNISSQNGKYNVTIPEGEYTVEVRTQDNGVAKVEDVSVTGGQVTTQNITLTAPGTLNGTIVNSTDDPVTQNGIRVIVHTPDYEVWRQATYYPSNGTYETTVPDGEYIVEVRNASGYAPKHVEGVTVNSDSTTTKKVSLSEPATITGRLVAGNSGIAGEMAVTDGQNWQFARTNKTGHFEVEVSGGNYSIQSRARQNGKSYYNSTPVDIAGGQTKDVGNISMLNPKVINSNLQYAGGAESKPNMTNLKLKSALFNGFMGVKIDNTSGNFPGGEPAKLEGEGVTENTRFKMTFTVQDFDPDSLLWMTKDVEWSVEDASNAPNCNNNCKNITVTANPVHLEAMPGQVPYKGPIPAGENPQELIDWPNSNNDKSTFTRNQTMMYYLMDLPENGFGAEFNNMTVTTNAQTFSQPTFEEGELDFYVGAPHETQYTGKQHKGFYRAFIPESVLKDWGVGTDGSGLSATYQGDPVQFSVNDTPDDGVWINADLHYSDGSFTVSNTSSNSGTDPADFAVSIEDTNSVVNEGETLEVETKISNTGDVEGTAELTFEVGSTTKTKDVTLAGTGSAGSQEKFTFTWDKTDGKDGIREVNVTAKNKSEGTVNDSETQNIEINGLPEFQVGNISTNDPSPGETLEVTATIENKGAMSDTQNIIMKIDGTQEDSASTTIGATSSKDVTLSWDTQSDTSGTFTVKIKTANDTREKDVTIEDSSGGGGGGGISGPALPGGGGGSAGDSGSSASTSITIDSVTSPVEVGDTVTIEATVSNPGNSSVGRTLDLTVGGSTLDSSFVTVPGGSSASATLTFTVTEAMADGSISFTVASSGDSASGTVDVGGTKGDAETDDDEAGEGEDEESEASEQEAEEADTGSSIPGFGPLAALLALLGWLGVLRRRQ